MMVSPDASVIAFSFPSAASRPRHRYVCALSPVKISTGYTHTH